MQAQVLGFVNQKKKIIEMHGGKKNTESKAFDKGSTFTAPFSKN
jgi:hypothetical protein